MDAKPLFSETQYFRQWWVIALLVVVNSIMVSPFFMSGGTEEDLVLKIMEFLLSLAISIFLLTIKLETEISDQGIQVRFFPFITHKKLFRWELIEHCEVIRSMPLRDFGGWGYRFNSNGRALTTAGRDGIQLKFKHKKEGLLIGTRRPEEVKRILTELGQLK